MPQSESNVYQHRISKEATWAAVPAGPTMRELRVKGPINLAPQKETRTSQLLRADRNISSRVEVFQGAGGGWGLEMTWGAEMDMLFEAAMVGVFRAIDITGQTVTVDAAAKTFTRAAGSFLTDGVLVGDYARWKGYTNAGNNGVFRVTAVTATVMTVSDGLNALVNEAGSGNEEYHVNTLRNGKRSDLAGWAGSLLIESYFSDIGKFISYRGARINSMDWNFRAGEIVEGSVSIIGERGVPASATVSGSVTPHTGHTPINATANVARIFRGSANVASAVMGLQIGLANNGRALKSMGRKYAGGVNQGVADVKGQVSAYLEDLTFVEDLVNHVSFGMEVVTLDENGHATVLWMPAVRLAAGQPDIQGMNTEVMQNFNIEAEAGAFPYTYQISRLAA